MLQLVKGIDMGVLRANNMLAGAIAVAALILSGCSRGVTATSEPSTLAQSPPNAQKCKMHLVREQAHFSYARRSGAPPLIPNVYPGSLIRTISQVIAIAPQHPRSECGVMVGRN